MTHAITTANRWKETEKRAKVIPSDSRYHELVATKARLEFNLGNIRNLIHLEERSDIAKAVPIMMQKEKKERTERFQSILSPTHNFDF